MTTGEGRLSTLPFTYPERGITVASYSPKQKAEEKLRKGVESLAVGKFASPWVCRELLGLDAEPSQQSIERALHVFLDSWEQRGDTETGPNLLSAVTAAAILLKLVRK